MPLFDPDGIRRLVGEFADGEHTLDLRGVSLAEAQAVISQIVEQRLSDDATSMVVLIDPATATSGETLFLPIGRQLLDARKRGFISRFHPLPEADGGGFYLELPPRSRSEDPQA